MSRKFILFSLLFLLIILVLFAFNSRNNFGKVVIINDSNEIISSLTINICGQEKTISDFLEGQKFEWEFIVRGDSHYSIFVVFSPHRKIEKNIGYVTPGFDYEHTIRITNQDIFIDTIGLK